MQGGGCNGCPVTFCTAVGASPSAAPSGGSAAGPIAGGVIGGIAVICLITFLIWRFCIKNRLAARRQQQEYDDWPETGPIDEKDADGFTMHRDARASMHSVRSIASTVLTRASNVIQIAYIPGVTNRSCESTPDLIPPVPPIPAASPAHSTATTPAAQDDQHFFMPSDLRDSTYSDYNVDSYYGRSSFGRPGSMQSTAYRGSAVVNTVPAQTAIRGKANPVKVKSNGKNSPAETPRSSTPPVPIMNRSRFPAEARNGSIKTNTTSPIVARLGVPKAVTVTKAASNSNLGAAAVKPSPLTIKKAERHMSVASSRHNGDSSTFDDASSSDDESPADQSLMGHEKLPHFIKTSPKANVGPFRSPSAPEFHHSESMASSSSPDSYARSLGSKERKQKHKRSGSLNQIIEEAARRASREPRHGGLGSGSVGSIGADWKRQSREGPFSDANAARTP